MKKKASIMGMPVSIEVHDGAVSSSDIEEVFSYFHAIDGIFSTYKQDSEIGKINRGEITPVAYSSEVAKILHLSEETKYLTHGFFDIYQNGKIDPSGIVKGYAIHQAALLLSKKGFSHFYINIGGDIEVAGNNRSGQKWRVGIENPFNRKEIIKVVYLSGQGIATSGTYIRGQHIYNPKNQQRADEIASMTVIGPNVYEADRFATAAFAMGEQGILFIESLADCEGYMVTKDKKAYYTRGFEKYTVNAELGITNFELRISN